MVLSHPPPTCQGWPQGAGALRPTVQSSRGPFIGKLEQCAAWDAVRLSISGEVRHSETVLHLGWNLNWRVAWALNVLALRWCSLFSSHMPGCFTKAYNSTGWSEVHCVLGANTSFWVWPLSCLEPLPLGEFLLKGPTAISCNTACTHSLPTRSDLYLWHSMK